VNAILAQWKAASLELLRSKLYAGIIAAGIMLVIASAALAELSLGETVVALTDIGLAFIALISVALGVGITTSSVSRAVSSREAIVLLARPIGRDTFILGRFLAAVTLVLAATISLGGLLALLVVAFDGNGAKVFVAAVFGAGEGILLCGVALVFAARSGPVMSGTLTTILFVVGRMDGGFDILIQRETFGGMTPLMKGLQFVLPQLSRFDLTAWIHGEAPSLTPGYTVLYGTVYTSGLLLLATLRFRRRDVM